MSDEPNAGRTDNGEVPDELRKAADLHLHKDYTDVVWAKARQEKRRTSWAAGLGAVAAAAALAVVVSQTLPGLKDQDNAPATTPTYTDSTSLPTTGQTQGTITTTTGTTTTTPERPSTAPVTTGTPDASASETGASGTSESAGATGATEPPVSGGTVELTFTRTKGDPSTGTPAIEDLVPFAGTWELTGQAPEGALPSGGSQPMTLELSPGEIQSGITVGGYWQVHDGSCATVGGDSISIDPQGTVTAATGNTTGALCLDSQEPGHYPLLNTVLDGIRSGASQWSVEGDTLSMSLPLGYDFRPTTYAAPVSDGETSTVVLPGVTAVLPAGMAVVYANSTENSASCVVAPGSSTPTECLLRFDRGAGVTAVTQDFFADAGGGNRTVCAPGLQDPSADGPGDATFTGPRTGTETVGGLPAQVARWDATCSDGTPFTPSGWLVTDQDLFITSLAGGPAAEAIVSSVSLDAAAAVPDPITGTLTQVLPDGVEVDLAGTTHTYRFDGATVCSNPDSGESSEISCTDWLERMYGMVGTDTNVLLRVTESGVVVQIDIAASEGG